MKSFKPSHHDLSENPPAPENLLRGFQGRPVRNRHQRVLPMDSFQEAHCIGRSNVIFYQSDKRDPKDPNGEGAQGFSKHFYHDQKPPSYLYVLSQTGEYDDFLLSLIDLCSANKQIQKASNTEGLCPPIGMPKTIVELADLEKVELSIGKQKFELEFDGYKLYVWDDMRTLMALPIAGGMLTHACVYIWCSNHTKVNWRGIID